MAKTIRRMLPRQLVGKTPWVKSILGLACALTMTVCVSCMTCNDNYSKQNHFILCSVSNRSIVVRSIHVIPNGDHPIVAGKVEALCIQDATYKEHVEISILAPDGKLLAHVNTNYLPREIPNNPRNPFRYATYAIKLPIVPPDWSSIRVATIED